MFETNGEISTELRPLLKTAQKEGAEEVELYAHHRIEKTVNFESNTLKSAVAGMIQGVGVRVLVRKSLGFACVNSFEKSRIEQAIRDAISIARVTPPASHFSLPSAKQIKSVRDIYDATLGNLSMEDVVKRSNDLLRAARGIDPRITIDSGLLVSRIDERAITTTAGIEASERKSSMSWALWGWAVDGTDIGSMDGEWDSVVSAGDFDIEAGMESFGKKVLQNLGAKKTDAFKGSALLSPEAAAELLSIVIIASYATAIQAGQSVFQDKLGETVAVRDLKITDDGQISKSVSSTSFDREGIPPTCVNIIASGVLKGILYNAFTAQKEELESTGHATGGFRSTPNIAPTNIEVGCGRKTLDAIVSEIDRGVYIQRISASPDLISGDFSAVVKGGRLIEHGELTSALKEITAVGNIYEGIKNISAVSNERRSLRTVEGLDFLPVPGSWLVPYLRMDNIDFVT